VVINYHKKIFLGNSKYAYEQTEDFYNRGLIIIEKILKLWTPPSYYFHYQKGGHLAALKAHEASNFFTRIDLSRFYYRVTKNKIIRSLVKAGFSFKEANEIAIESVVKTAEGYCLPYGFVQSSLISSLVLSFSGLGGALRYEANSFNVSVYVDDILISQKGKLSEIRNFSETVCIAAAHSNFPINLEKTEIGKTEIEIFNIDLAQNSKSICDKRLGEFLVEVKSSDSDERANSMIAYVRQVNVIQSNLLYRARYGHIPN